MIEIGAEVTTKKKIREKCKAWPEGLYFFAKAVLGFDKLKPHLHLPVANYLQMHPWNGGHARSNRKLLWMPREHFKSTLASIALPLWLLSCVDRNMTIALISAHSDNTKGWLGQIRDIVDGNGLFRWLFKEIRRGRKWDEERLIITRDQNLSGDSQASITSYSINSGLASQHHDYIILDDPVNEQVAESDVEMEKAVRLYIHLEEILRGWQRSGFLVIGTPWGREDVLQEALKEERRGYRLKWGVGVRGKFEISKSIQDIDCLIPKVESGKPILPTECDEDKLAHIKKQDKEKYTMQYLCEPFVEDDNGFKLSLIRDFAEMPDGTLKCQCHPLHIHHLKDASLVYVSDPAYTKEKKSCETSILLGALLPCGCRFLFEDWGGHIQPKEYIEKACEFANKNKTWLRAYCVEDEALQLALAQWLVEKKNTGAFPLKVQIHGLKAKNRAKDSRIANAQPAVNNGLWHKRPSMQHIEGENNLLQQLFQWPYSRKRDRADAFAYFEDAFKEFPPRGERQNSEGSAYMPGINARREAADMETYIQEEALA